MSLQNLSYVCSHLQNVSRARLAQTSIKLTKMHLSFALALQKQGFISSVDIGGTSPPQPPQDTILPQHADILTYQEYTDLVRRIRKAEKDEVKALEPWTWSSPKYQQSVPTAPLLTESEYNLRPWLLSYESSERRVPLKHFIRDPALLLRHKKNITLLSHELWSTHTNSLAHGHQSSSDNVLAKEPWRAYPDPHPFFHQPGLRPGPDPWEQVPDNPASRRLWLGLKYYRNEPVISKCHIVSKTSRTVTMKLDEIAKVVRGENARSSKGVAVPGLREVGECLFLKTDMGVLEARECITNRRGGTAIARVS